MSLGPAAATAEAPQRGSSVDRVANTGGTQRGWRWGRIVTTLVTLGLLLWVGASVDRHLRAAALLLRFSGPEAVAAASPLESLATYREYAVVVEERVYGPSGAPARLYLPAGREDPPGVALVHGMHTDGIDEPRLVELARAFAASGVAVYTPRIDALTRYHIDAASVRAIAEGAQALAAELDRPSVGVIGVSFAGGLALLAPQESEVGSAIAFVVAVGAHHDLSRVARWYVGEAAVGPDGRRLDVAAHPYGAGVFVYGAAELFFPAAEVTEARAALTLLLEGKRTAARARAARLGPQSRAILAQAIDFESATPELVQRYLEAVEARRDALSEASPASKIGALDLPVFLLHGLDDPIVPSTETAFLAAELPDESGVLVTSALRHAERARDEDLEETWKLVRFMAGVLAEAGD